MIRLGGSKSSYAILHLGSIKLNLNGMSNLKKKASSVSLTWADVWTSNLLMEKEEHKSLYHVYIISSLSFSRLNRAKPEWNAQPQEEGQWCVPQDTEPPTLLWHKPLYHVYIISSLSFSRLKRAKPEWNAQPQEEGQWCVPQDTKPPTFLWQDKSINHYTMHSSSLFSSCLGSIELNLNGMPNPKKKAKSVSLKLMFEPQTLWQHAFILSFLLFRRIDWVEPERRAQPQEEGQLCFPQDTVWTINHHLARQEHKPCTMNSYSLLSSLPF